MKHVLLTGATGFLGSHLLQALLEEGYDVIILKRSTSDTWRINQLLDQVQIYDLDIHPLVKIFKEQTIDVIVHLATLYRKFETGSEVAPMIQANITFPMELLECAVQNNVKGFINTGTFFESDCSKLPLKENARDKPFNFYAKTKLAFESILNSYSYEMPSVTLRLFSPYGEKDNEKLLPRLIQAALKNETMKLSDGLQKLDFVYAKDIVSAYMKAIKKLEGSTSGHDVYNIGSGQAISIREVVSLIEQNLGCSIKKEWGEPSDRDLPIVFADTSKAALELKWAPTYSIHVGLKKTISYYRTAINED